MGKALRKTVCERKGDIPFQTPAVRIQIAEIIQFQNSGMSAFEISCEQLFNDHLNHIYQNWRYGFELVTLEQLNCH